MSPEMPTYLTAITVSISVSGPDYCLRFTLSCHASFAAMAPPQTVTCHIDLPHRFSPLPVTAADDRRQAAFRGGQRYREYAYDMLLLPRGATRSYSVC